MPSGYPEQIGDTNPQGWTVLTDAIGGKKDYQCPFCDTKFHRNKAPHEYSCGCTADPLRVPVPKQEWSREQYPEMIRQAIAAFRTDSAYGIAIAKAAHNVGKRGSSSSSTL